MRQILVDHARKHNANTVSRDLQLALAWIRKQFAEQP